MKTYWTLGKLRDLFSVLGESWESHNFAEKLMIKFLEGYDEYSKF